MSDKQPDLGTALKELASRYLTDVRKLLPAMADRIQEQEGLGTDPTDPNDSAGCQLASRAHLRHVLRLSRRAQFLESMGL